MVARAAVLRRGATAVARRDAALPLQRQLDGSHVGVGAREPGHGYGRVARRQTDPDHEVVPVKILHSLLSLLERIVTLPFRLVRGIMPGGRKPRP